MWFENVVIILTWFVLLISYFKICVESKKLFNIIVLGLDMVFALIYFTQGVFNTQLNNFLLSLTLLFMYLIPIISAFLRYNNIAVKQKIISALGKFYYSMGRYDIAIRLYTHIIKTDKKKVTSNNYYILGRCLRKEKRYSDARDMLIEAIELDKENYLAYYELGLALSALNNKDTAVIMFSNSLKVNPDYVEASIALAVTYSEIGRVREAVSIYQELINNNVADEEVLYNLANIYYYELDDMVKAEECYIKATTINNKLYAAWYNLGNINYLKGDYEASIKYLNVARQSEVFRDKAEYSLSKSYLAIKENEKAIKILSKLIERDETYIDKIKNEIIFEEILSEVIKNEK